jgi:CARDB
LGEISGPDTVQVFHARPARRRRHLPKSPTHGEAPGAPSFSVRATDPAGNTGPPATHSWTIVVPRPDLYVSAFSRFSITISNKGHGERGAVDAHHQLDRDLQGAEHPRRRLGDVLVVDLPRSRLHAVVDREQAVIESDETNNTATLRNTCS